MFLFRQSFIKSSSSSCFGVGRNLTSFIRHLSTNSSAFEPNFVRRGGSSLTMYCRRSKIDITPFFFFGVCVLIVCFVARPWVTPIVVPALDDARGRVAFDGLNVELALSVKSSSIPSLSLSSSSISENGNLPSAISTSVIPKLHTSDFTVYCAPCIRSGDIYVDVPTKVSAIELISSPETPKSHNLICPFEFIKIFDGFTSLCIILCTS